MLNEFKQFAMKGNMLDMAVGIIIGAAFGTIISSLVNDVLMPPVGMLLGGGRLRGAVPDAVGRDGGGAVSDARVYA